jgi:hypothetical protein
MSEECSICLEAFEPHHTIARPEACTHPFHVACITTWLRTTNRSCPLCRREITYNAEIQWRTVLNVSLMLTRQIILERSLCAFTFLSMILKNYPSAKSFKDNFPKILSAIEHLQIIEIRLPFMAIPTREEAKRERRRWRQVAEALLEGHVIKPNQIEPYQQTIQNYFEPQHRRQDQLPHIYETAHTN